MHKIPIRQARCQALVWLTLATVSLGGCSSQADPAPDLDTTFADLAKQIQVMATTLEAIPNEFELDTPKKVKAANQLLEDTASQLAAQAAAFQEARGSLRTYSNMTGAFDDSAVYTYVEAIERFESQWNRIERSNPQATQRLEPARRIVQDAT